MGSIIPHSGAILLVREKIPYLDGSFVAIKIWQVPREPRMPEGLKYSFVYIDPRGKRVLGYDNAEGKGHHRHAGRIETPYQFTSIEDLRQLFIAEIEELRRKRHEN